MTGFPKSATHRFTLYGAAISPFVRKARVVLAEKRIPYELIQFNIFSPPPWFAAISPLRRIPVLHDAQAQGDGLLADSSVIAAYLEKIAPSPALYPADPWDFAQAMWLEEYADGGLVPPMGNLVFRPRVLSRLMGTVCDEALVQKGMTETLPPYFAYLEARLAGREFLVGDSLTIADIATACPFINIRHAGEAPDATKFPALTGYLARLCARESFAACVAEENAILGRIRQAK